MSDRASDCVRMQARRRARHARDVKKRSFLSVHLSSIFETSSWIYFSPVLSCRFESTLEINRTHKKTEKEKETERQREEWEEEIERQIERKSEKTRRELKIIRWKSYVSRFVFRYPWVPGVWYMNLHVWVCMSVIVDCKYLCELHFDSDSKSVLELCHYKLH